LTSESSTAVAHGILEEVHQIKEQNLEILRLLRSAKDRRWYDLQEAGERLGRKAWTLGQLCRYGSIQAEQGANNQWRISADELARLEREGVPKLPQRSAK